ncbi:hypothetical protein FRZ44_39210 [Hypericibacter terrae]|uniref:Uncharacterized protein n=1 Tax=Hypericibacter terrae TaxID=2602015 RepID=A0A5J6MMB6_9PROT|nr:hypothetical protein FRZ44_39210 [Hypericibacter terrae]
MVVRPKTKKDKPAAIELEPDAWPRFEQFIKQVAKAGPQHRPAAKAKTRKTKP